MYQQNKLYRQEVNRGVDPQKVLTQAREFETSVYRRFEDLRSVRGFGGSCGSPLKIYTRYAGLGAHAGLENLRSARGFGAARERHLEDPHSVPEFWGLRGSRLKIYTRYAGLGVHGRP